MWALAHAWGKIPKPTAAQSETYTGSSSDPRILARLILSATADALHSTFTTTDTTTHTALPQNASIQTLLQRHSIHNDTDQRRCATHACSVLPAAQLQHSINSTDWADCTEVKLAKEQLQKLTAGTASQFIGFLSGPGGSGKSRVISAIKAFAVSWGATALLRVTATTGVAAVNVGGSTIHSLAHLNTRRLEKSSKDMPLAGVALIIVDEVSMLSAADLGKLDNNLKVLCGRPNSTTRFGGINMLFAGDFNQLSPVSNTATIYDFDYITRSTTAKASGGDYCNTTIGLTIWKSCITHAYFLKRNYRSDQDADYASFLSNLRQGVLTKDHLQKLRDRIISPDLVPPVDSVTAFYDNHNVIASNISCAHIAANAIGAPVLRLTAQVPDCHLPESVTHVNPTIGKSATRKRGKNAPKQRAMDTRSKADLPLSHLDLYIGCPVSFKAPGGNANNSFGLSNGSIGYFIGTHPPLPPADCETKTVTTFTNLQATVHSPRTPPNYLLLHVPGCTAIYSGLPPGIVPIRATTTSEAGPNNIVLKVTQFRVKPRHSSTAHKLQGKTEPSIIIGQFMSSKQVLNFNYVLSSRVGSWRNLYILRGINIGNGNILRDDLKHDSRQRLDNEVRRLQTLSKQTATLWSDIEGDSCAQ